MGEASGTLPEQNTHLDKTILLFVRIVECYVLSIHGDLAK